MSIRPHRRLLAGAVALGALTAATIAAGAASATTAPPSDDTGAASEAPAGSDAATAEVPPAFADGSAHIAVVAQLSAGDYFEQWRAGAEAQAEALGIELDFLSADGDNDRHALNLQQAVSEGADAIIVDHGFPETIQPAIGEAVAAGIPLVAFDVDPGEHEVVTLTQSDEVMAGAVLEVLGEDTGGEGDVIYVYVAGFAPLDRRDAVWQEFKAANPGINEVAQIGVVSDNTAAQVAEQAKAALQANPDVTAIFAPYDEFAKGAKQAIVELGLEDQVRVYGADISNADIAEMTAEGSPWVATAGTDASNVGAVAVRAAALLAAGLETPDAIVVPPALITQQLLRDEGIENVGQLIEFIPELSTPEIVPIPWLPAE
jgi:simple sugar transport system substrate-binding protein